ncbi:MAG: TetR/AcrR family transcriptional regulator [Thermoleophilia bacterium]
MSQEIRLRPDAQRNREKLMAAAVAAFAEDGVRASLEQIARRAGVGIGTLYRHFPSRDALVAAVYRQEVGRLAAAAPELLAEYPPDVALRRWMDRFVEYAATKRGLGEALKAAMESDSELHVDGFAALTGALDALVGAAIAAGTIRADARGDDVLRALGAVWMIRDGDDREEQTTRTLDLIVDGLRYGAPGGAGGGPSRSP